MKYAISIFAMTFCTFCTLCGLLVLAGASGCADVVVRPSESSQANAYQAAPVDDGRSASQILSENASLRTTLQNLEQKHNTLVSAVKTQEQIKDDLKDQRKRVEKERDRYKKRFEDVNDD